MKICSKCKDEKELEQFDKNKKQIDGHSKLCKICSREQSKKSYFRTSGKRNKYLIERRRKIAKDFEKNLWEIKAKCIKCGFDHVAALDFHHRDPGQKIDTIGNLKWAGVSKETFQKELDKCDIICANCHRILHWEEKNNAK